MKWIIFPRQMVKDMIEDRKLATTLSSIILEELPESYSLELSKDLVLYGVCRPVLSDARLFGLWWSNKLAPMANVTSYLSISASPDNFNITSLEGEDRIEFLDRALRLAHHIWGTMLFPTGWVQKKLEGLNTIFAGDRRLLDLRFGYTHRRFEKLDIIDVGDLFYARKQEKRASVPQVDIDVGQKLPEELHPPKQTEAISDQLPIDESLMMPLQEGDFLIAARQSGYHLFSLSYDQWTALGGPLTHQQRRVIQHRVRKPLRIHGPAGSGKTLVLILKSLFLLREAAERGEICHILFAVTSNAVAQTVRTAIETIDEKSFLATTVEDKQYLDIATLHGWCIRELGLEEGAEYVLERDPKESKRKQTEILRSVFEQVITERYNKLRSSFSPDLVKLVENHRETLLRELQWEIAIRIKGRGYRIGDRELYIKSLAKTFLGAKANIWDKHLIFHIYEKYENRFKEENFLDTDDVVLSMSARLSTSLWDRQRKKLGYDYVVVDETHLFNDNERRVLPLLTRGESEYPHILMTFDETQSIGGSRGINLESIGISVSERRNLDAIHRSSPDIFALARDLVERSPLAFTEFLTEKSVSMMGKNELKRCRKPLLVYVQRGQRFEDILVVMCDRYRKLGYIRIGIILFDNSRYAAVTKALKNSFDGVFEIEERGEKIGAIPQPGYYVMTPETCGGLEFEAVLLVGADKGCIPIPLGDLSREGYQSVLEESYIELYTAVTRAKYVLTFLSDDNRGISELLVPSINSGLIQIESS